MSVSIYDIAKEANVSPSTVSRALQDHPRISAKTKKRIQELAKKMEYVPSMVAKSLSVNQTWTIGMVLATISDYQRGISVPDHLSVLMATYTIPPLTTIRQPRFEMGRRAMELLLDLLDGQKPESQLISGELVMQQTTDGLLPRKSSAAAGKRLLFFCAFVQLVAQRRSKLSKLFK